MIPQIVKIADIPNSGPIKILPGATRDLEEIASKKQIEQSNHLRVHILAGRLSVETQGPKHYNGIVTSKEMTIFVDEAKGIKISNPSANSDTLQISFDYGNNYFEIPVSTVQSFDTAIDAITIKATSGTQAYQIVAI